LVVRYMVGLVTDNGEVTVLDVGGVGSSEVVARVRWGARFGVVA
jgi:hypothetical protein